MPLAARINLVTLGTADLAAATAFYERLGWRRSARWSSDEVSFVALDNLVLGLFGRAALAADMGLAAAPQPATGGFSLAINVASEAEVDAVLAQAAAAGATILKPGEKTFWGGYAGYFADLDGHAWEVAHNPFFPLDDMGRMTLPA